MSIRRISAAAELARVASSAELRAPKSLREFWRGRALWFLSLTQRAGATNVEMPDGRLDRPLQDEVPGPVVIAPNSQGDFAAISVHAELTSWNFDADEIVARLGNARRVLVGLNCPGGDIHMALKLVAALRGREVTVEISEAFSAAAVLAMAGQRRRMAKDGWLMVHSPVSYASGTPKMLRWHADNLERTAGQVADVFVQAGIPRRLVERWHDGRDHYFNATDALRVGLVHEVYEPEEFCSPSR